MAAASSAPPTVSALKLSFLAAQISVLAKAPAPSSAWRAANDASDQPVAARAVDDALLALGQAIQQHCRRVYAPQASRHVADQISDAYVRDAERRVVAQGEAAAGAVARELDLVDDDSIEALPPSWPVARQVSDYPLEARRYADGVSRLVELNEQRRELRRRVERLRRLKETVDPLAAGGGVQENLVTRNGPVEAELERMRLLLARVAGRVSELPARGPDGGSVPVASLAGARKRTVDEFLADGRVFSS